MSRIPCEYCSTCSRPACESKNPAPVPVPVPVPKPTPQPVAPVAPIVPVPTPPPPAPLPSSGKIGDWFAQDLWDKIFPYADLSAVYCPTDKQPMFRREDFLAAIDYINNLPDKRFSGFCGSKDKNTNLYEMAAFLANFDQECGDGSLNAPFPWMWPKPDSISGPEVGHAGGALCVLEGLLPIVAHHKTGTAAPKGILAVSKSYDDFRPVARKTIGLRPDDSLSCTIASIEGAKQLHFGLGAGTGAGAVFQPGLVAVSDDGTLWGDEPRADKDIVRPTKELVRSTTDRRYANLGTYGIYGGRNCTMLSYNFNYCPFSLDIFGDYRAARYPNLLITTDRKTWNGLPEVFGFPGPNPGGKNSLPEYIDKSTPNARIVGWLSALWFWMIPQSGRPISCHGCMIEPTKYGITGVNLIVNNQSGLVEGTWAEKKILYYKRICAIFGIPVGNTIVSPPGIK